MNTPLLLASLALFGAVLESSSCRGATSKSAVTVRTSSAARKSRHLTQAPDIVGTITTPGALDRQLVWVEADPIDPTLTGRGTPKAQISNFFQALGSQKARTGCIVRVWYDESMPVQDSNPPIAVADSVAVVRCK
jgi:hypothetical protein